MAIFLSSCFFFDLFFVNFKEFIDLRQIAHTYFILDQFICFSLELPVNLDSSCISISYDLVNSRKRGVIINIWSQEFIPEMCNEIIGVLVVKTKFDQL